jgi:hypothetical protein
MLVGGAVAVWLAYQAYQSLKAPAAAVSAAGGAATSAIANLFPGTSSSVTPQGTVLMPDGSQVPVANMVNNGFDSSGNLSMNYGGSTYTITSAGGGVYNATLQGLGSVDRFRGGLWR